MSNKVYDFLKWIAQIFLPATATLCFALASVWGIPYSEQIVGTITAVDAFLGVLLGVSSAKYANSGGKLMSEYCTSTSEKYKNEAK